MLECILLWGLLAVKHVLVWGFRAIAYAAIGLIDCLGLIFAWSLFYLGRWLCRFVALVARIVFAFIVDAVFKCNKQRMISSLLKEEDRTTHGISEDVCTICWDNPTNLAKIDGCSHSFCFCCINKWSERQNTCPLCKVRFSNISHLDKNRKKIIIKGVKHKNQGRNVIVFFFKPLAPTWGPTFRITMAFSGLRPVFTFRRNPAGSDQIYFPIRIEVGYMYN